MLRCITLFNSSFIHGTDSETEEDDATDEEAEEIADIGMEYLINPEKEEDPKSSKQVIISGLKVYQILER